MIFRTYTELCRLKTFEERFDYLKLDGRTGDSTFGFDRHVNQSFYRSRLWRQIRQEVIIRDEACDLAIPERSILQGIQIHHMNPVTMEDLELERDIVLDPEFLICVSHSTHNAIHFGSRNNLITLPKEREKGDTTLWTVS
jgi:hypothetical protein